MEECTIDFTSSTLATPFFTLAGTCTYARVVDVHDGDTLTVVFPYHDKMVKFSVRLYGIDTCEITSKNGICKQLAQNARKFLIDHILGIEASLDQKEVRAYLNANVRVVWLECLSFDKYHRLLAHVYTKKADKSLSELLIKNKLAYPYFGATKLSEEEQIDYFSTA